MNSIDKILYKTFSYGLPVITVLLIWSSSIEKPNASPAYNFIGFVLISWCLTSSIFFLKVLLQKDLRENILKKLMSFKERDEREVMVTGQATKTAFFASLTLLSAFLFFSCIQLSIHRVAKPLAIEGKTGTISLGFKFDLIDKEESAYKEEGIEKSYISYSGIPLSKPAMILFFIMFQVLFYQFTIRKNLN